MDQIRKLAAEAIGTFWLTFAGCGSAVIAAGFPQVGIGLLGVSLAFGLTVVTMAYSIGHVSGCHLNPAVTIGLAAGGRFPTNQIAPYVIAQVIGAIVGDPPQARGRIRTWARDPDVWVRRTALLCQHDQLAHGGGDFELWTAIAVHLPQYGLGRWWLMVVFTVMNLYLVYPLVLGRSDVSLARDLSYGRARRRARRLPLPAWMFSRQTLETEESVR